MKHLCHSFLVFLLFFSPFLLTERVEASPNPSDFSSGSQPSHKSREVRETPTHEVLDQCAGALIGSQSPSVLNTALGSRIDNFDSDTGFLSGLVNSPFGWLHASMYIGGKEAAHLNDGERRVHSLIQAQKAKRTPEIIQEALYRNNFGSLAKEVNGTAFSKAKFLLDQIRPTVEAYVLKQYAFLTGQLNAMEEKGEEQVLFINENGFPFIDRGALDRIEQKERADVQAGRLGRYSRIWKPETVTVLLSEGFISKNIPPHLQKEWIHKYTEKYLKGPGKGKSEEELRLTDRVQIYREVLAQYVIYLFKSLFGDFRGTILAEAVATSDFLKDPKVALQAGAFQPRLMNYESRIREAFQTLLQRVRLDFNMSEQDFTDFLLGQGNYALEQTSFQQAYQDFLNGVRDVLSIKTWVPEIDFQNNLYTLSLPGAFIQAIYSPELGSQVIRPLLSSDEKRGGIKLPEMFLFHGMGTTESNAASFALSMPTVAELSHFHLAAPDMPNAGMGISMPDVDLEAWSASLANSVEWLESFMGQKFSVVNDSSPGYNYSPRLFFGRSAGSSAAHLLNFWYPLQNFDVQVLSSYAAYETLDQQVKAVQEQVRLGNLEGLDPVALRFAVENIKAIEHLYEGSTRGERRAFNLASVNTLHLLPESDEEVSIDGVKAAQRIVSEYLPLAHRYYIRNPLKGTKYDSPDYSIDGKNAFAQIFPFLEATHHLLNMRDNTSSEDARTFFPDLPTELIPKKRNQLHEVLGLHFLMMDMELEQLPLLQEALVILQAQAARLQGGARVEKDKEIRVLENRIHVALRAKKYAESFFEENQASSYLEWYVKKQNILWSEVEEADPRVFFSLQNKIRKEFIANGNKGPVLLSTGLSYKAYLKLDLVNRFAKLLKYKASELRRFQKALSQFSGE